MDLSHACVVLFRSPFVAAACLSFCFRFAVDFQSHFTSLDQDSIEIGGEMSIVIEEDDSGDVDHQTGLMLRSDQIESYVEVMPLDDSYTEVLSEPF